MLRYKCYIYGICKRLSFRIKALEIKTSMLFNLDFPNNTILSCFFYLFLNHCLVLSNSCSYCTNFNLIAELVIPIGIPAKETKAGMEKHLVIVEAKIRKCSILI